MSARAYLLAVALAAACGRSGFADLDDAARGSDALAADDGGNLIDTVSSGPKPLHVDVQTFSTTSPTFAPVTQLLIPPSPGTNWLLLFSAGLDSTSLAEIGVEIRYVIDGTERGLGGTQSSVAGRPGPWQHFYAVAGRTTEIPVGIELRDAAGGTATVTNLHVIAVPLPAGSDLQFLADDAPRIITTTTYTATSTFDLMPSGPGDYIVLALVNASDAPGDSDCYVQWRAGTSLYLADTQQPRESWQSMLTAWRQTIPTSPFSIKLETHVGSGMSRVSYARVLAVRADAFPTALVQNKMPVVMTTQANVLAVDELQPTAAAGSSFLYLASVRLSESCGPPVPTTFADRIAHFAVDGVETSSIDHRAANCAYQTTYGHAQLLEDPPTRLTTSISSGNAKEVDADESSIVLLGLP